MRLTNNHDLQNMRFLRITLLFALLISAFAIGAQTPKKASRKPKAICGPECEAGNKSGTLSCKLTTPELRQRKETVIASLKAKVVSKKALKNGYVYAFAGTDEVVDELISFIKTERQCCDFFVFNLSISGDKSEARMEITGPKGAKEFIDTELAL